MRKENNELSKPVSNLQTDSEIFSVKNLFRGDLTIFAQLGIYWMAKTASFEMKESKGDVGRQCGGGEAKYKI